MDVKQKIFDLLKENSAKYVDFAHDASGPSNLSREIRARHGYPDAVGAKSLILVANCKKDDRTSEKRNIVCVLPGHEQLDKKKFKSTLPQVKDFRFATSEELMDLTGLVPGSVPPFGKPLLNVDIFVIDEKLREFQQLGFNCGSLTHSIVIDSAEYFKVVKPDVIARVGDEK